MTPWYLPPPTDFSVIEDQEEPLARICSPAEVIADFAAAWTDPTVTVTVDFPRGSVPLIPSGRPSRACTTGSTRQLSPSQDQLDGSFFPVFLADEKMISVCVRVDWTGSCRRRSTSSTAR